MTVLGHPPRSRSMARARPATPRALTPAPSSPSTRTPGCSRASTASSQGAAKATPARPGPRCAGSLQGTRARLAAVILRLELHHLLPLLAQPVHPERDHVAGLEEFRLRLHPEPDARRRAGGDDVARLQHEELRAVPDEVLAVENHGSGIAALALLAVDVEPHVEA